MSHFRIERDSIGDVQVPANAYYGAETQRAITNSALSGQRLPLPLIHALARVKGAAACANRDLGLLPANIADSIIRAAHEVASGKFDAEFPIDLYQTGSGTSSNMNVNEVVANLAIELTGGDRFQNQKPINPHDHVNLGQSTNDVFPTAIHVAVGLSIVRELIPALEKLHAELETKAVAWNDIIKIGRTHLNDAVPLRLGQEFSGFARQLELSVERAHRALQAIEELPIGGTAVGTGLNAHPELGRRVSSLLSQETGIPFREAVNHFEANARRDALIECSGDLRSIAVTLFSVADNIRWLASGPRCGFGEVILPDLQPGSSIMPGKVNPVMSEGLMQIAARVQGNDHTAAFCGAAGGHFQMNAMMPVLGSVVLESAQLLAGGASALADRCVRGMQPNRERCHEQVERSLSLAAGLNPLIGYAAASVLVHEAVKTGRTLRELCDERIAGENLKKSDGTLITSADIQSALDPERMTGNSL